MNNCLYAQQADSLQGTALQYPRIEFEEREYDLGRFAATGKDSLKVHTFTFRNTGGKDLVIHHIATGCGCTQATFTQQLVRPGEKGIVAVFFRGAGQRLGLFRKTVTVFSNDPRSYVRIAVRSELVKPDESPETGVGQ